MHWPQAIVKYIVPNSRPSKWLRTIKKNTVKSLCRVEETISLALTIKIHTQKTFVIQALLLSNTGRQFSSLYRVTWARNWMMPARGACRLRKLHKSTYILFVLTIATHAIKMDMIIFLRPKKIYMIILIIYKI